MSLSCIGAESFRLNYQIGGLLDVVYVAQEYLPNSTPRYESRWIGKIGESLSFEIETDLSRDKYHAYGTFTDIGVDGNGETMYYEHDWINPLVRESFEIDASGQYWSFFGMLTEEATGGDRRRFGYVWKVEEDAYLRGLTEDNDGAPRNRVLEIRTPNPNGFTTSPGASGLSSPQIVRFGYSTYNVLISADGELLTTAVTAAHRESRYTPEDDIATIEQIEGIENKSEVFTKDSPSQGVEVLPAPGEPHKKEVWLVDVDDEGEEAGRRKVFEFELLPSQGIPQHSIECIYFLGECPENTCAVNCATHMCCYGSDGEPVHSYEL